MASAIFFYHCIDFKIRVLMLTLLTSIAEPIRFDSDISLRNKLTLFGYFSSIVISKSSSSTTASFAYLVFLGSIKLFRNNINKRATFWSYFVLFVVAYMFP